MAGEKSLITIVGCGPGSPDYVTPAAAKAIKQADVLLGAQRLLDLFPEHRGERIPVETKIGQLLDRVDETAASKKIAVLVTGDPGLFSLSKLVIERFGRQRCRVIPGISSVQAAFAALGLDWVDARVISAHKNDPELDAGLAGVGKIAVLCGRKGCLQWIGEKLNHFLAENRRIFVLENLTLENERIREIPYEDLKTMDVAPRTIVILLRENLVP
jgi:cobalt-precorrin-7 (C5)-methyltransferase